MKADTEKIHEGSQFRKILTHAPWYFLSSFLSKALGFILLPIYTRYLSPEDYGTLSTLQSFGNLSAIIISLYMDAAFIRFYYQEREISIEQVRKLYSTYFWFIIIWGSFASIVLTFVAPLFMSKLIDISVWPIALIISSQLLSQLSSMVLRIWRAELKAKQVAIVTLSSTIVIAIITLTLLVQFGFGWMSQVYATTIGFLLQTIVLLLIAIQNNWIKWTFDASMLKTGLFYAIPLIPNVSAGWIAGYSDRLILSYYGFLHDVGIYAIGYQFAYIMYIFNDSIRQVQGPMSMSGFVSDKGRAKKNISEFIVVHFWFVSLLYLGLALFSRDVIEMFLDERYQGAYKVIAILALLYLVSSIYSVFTTIIAYHRKSWIISGAALIQAAINMALNFSLIPIFGMYAAALSSVISLCGYLIWIVTWAQKLDPIRIPWRQLFITILYLSGIIGVWLVLDSMEYGVITFGLKVLLILVYIIGTLSLQSFNLVRQKIKRVVFLVESKWVL